MCEIREPNFLTVVVLFFVLLILANWIMPVRYHESRTGRRSSGSYGPNPWSGDSPRNEVGRE